MDWWLLVVGFGVGLLIGLTSMGGAALMTPFLILVVGVRPVTAVGTDLAYSAITKFLGAWMHWRQGTVDWPLVKKLAMGSVPGSIMGVLLIEYVHRRGANPDFYLRRTIGALLILVALVLLLRAFRSEWLQAVVVNVKGNGIIFWGATVGFAVGFTSVGSGSMIAPLLLLIFRNEPVKAVGTDVFHAAILVTVAAAAHSGLGTVNWSLVATLLVGSLPGVAIGSYLAPRLPVGTLRTGLALVLLASGVRMM